MYAGINKEAAVSVEVEWFYGIVQVALSDGRRLEYNPACEREMRVCS